MSQLSCLSSSVGEHMYSVSHVNIPLRLHKKLSCIALCCFRVSEVCHANTMVVPSLWSRSTVDAFSDPYLYVNTGVSCPAVQYVDQGVVERVP